MVEVIHQLGHVMGLKTIAEFVESREIMESLREIGVDYAQGYHIGRPIPFKEVFYGEKGAALDIAAPDLDQPLAVTLP